MSETKESHSESRFERMDEKEEALILMRRDQIVSSVTWAVLGAVIALIGCITIVALSLVIGMILLCCGVGISIYGMSIMDLPAHKGYLSAAETRVVLPPNEVAHVTRKDETKVESSDIEDNDNEVQVDQMMELEV